MSDIEPTEIVWETPPARRNNKSAKHQDFADALRVHPGEWAVFNRGISPSIANDIRRGGYKAFRPAGTFEVRTVSKGGLFDIYVRFVGEDGAS